MHITRIHRDTQTRRGNDNERSATSNDAGESAAETVQNILKSLVSNTSYQRHMLLLPWCEYNLSDTMNITPLTKLRRCIML